MIHDHVWDENNYISNVATKKLHKKNINISILLNQGYKSSTIRTKEMLIWIQPNKTKHSINMKQKKT